VHLGIQLLPFILGGAGRCDQGGINDSALPHRHALRAEFGFDSVKDLLAKLVFLHQVAKGQDRGLIRIPVADQFDACKASHDRQLDLGLLHGWIAEGIPLLQQVDPHYRGQLVKKQAAFPTGLWEWG
jgi:hypothetical protein